MSQVTKHLVIGWSLNVALLLLIYADLLFGNLSPATVGGLGNITLLAMWCLNLLITIVSLSMMHDCHQAEKSYDRATREKMRALIGAAVELRRQRKAWSKWADVTVMVLVAAGLAFTGFMFSAFFYLCAMLLGWLSVVAQGETHDRLSAAEQQEEAAEASA